MSVKDLLHSILYTRVER